jgi:uncharacterized protein
VPNQEYQIHNKPLENEINKLTIPPGLSTPNRPHWNWWMAFALWGASVALIIIVPGIILAFYAVISGKISNPQLMAESSDVILVNLIAVLPAHFLTLLFAWLIVTKPDNQSFRQALGWEMGGFKIVHLVLIVIGFFVLSAIVSYFIPEQDNELLKILRSSRAAVLVIAFIATFTAPLVEEVVYRGVMYSAALKEFGQTQAIICSTAYFALVHVPQYYPSFSTILIILVLSFVLTLIRAKSNNLLPCIILHTIFNGVQSFFLVSEPYLKQYLPPEKVGFIFN